MSALFKPDKPHGPYPKHMDIIQPLPDIPGIQKLRVDVNGKILTDDILMNPSKGDFLKK